MLKVLVVDDSALFRSFLEETLKELPEIGMIERAPNGAVALEKFRANPPDLVTLDIEMPEMDGITTLQHMIREKPDCRIIMVSAFTTEGARITLKALNLGAMDFIGKPESANLAETRELLREQLHPKVKAMVHHARIIEETPIEKPAPPVEEKPVKKEKEPEKITVKEEIKKEPAPAPAENRTSAVFLKKDFSLLAIGVSTGGPKALAEFLKGINKDFPLPVLIVQHMPKLFTAALAESLSRVCPIPVREAVDEESVSAGTVYLAPGGVQMKVKKNPATGGLSIQLTDDPPENYCKPSVDYLFRSLSRNTEKPVLAMIMTGMGADGKIGTQLLKRQSAVILAQDQETSVVWGMPGEVVKSGSADRVLALQDMASEVNRLVGSRVNA